MRLVSYRRDGRDSFGAVVDGRVVDLRSRSGERCADLRTALSEFPSGELQALAAQAGDTVALAECELLPVIPNPVKILCIGLNYDEHRRETGREKTGHPTVFVRFADTQIGHEQPGWVPGVSRQVDYEGELAVVIGKPGRFIAPENALDHVAGYSCYNDISVRDWQQHTTQFTPGKNFPHTGAFGPWLVTADELPDPAGLELTTRLNGTVMQHAYTRDLIFPVPELIAYCSGFTALGTGDVIVTGTPGGVGFRRNPPVFLKAGDVVEVEISSVGLLRTPIEAAP